MHRLICCFVLIWVVILLTAGCGAGYHPELKTPTLEVESKKLPSEWWLKVFNPSRANSVQVDLSFIWPAYSSWQVRKVITSEYRVGPRISQETILASRPDSVRIVWGWNGLFQQTAISPDTTTIRQPAQQ